MNNHKLIVLHIITSLSSNGAQIMLYNMLTKTDRNYFQPIVISLMDRSTLGDLIESLGITVYTLDMHQGTASITSIYKLLRIVRQIKPNIIQCWMYHGNLAGFLASLFLRQSTPIVWSIHHSITSLVSETTLTRIIIRLCSIISRNVDVTIFVSSMSRNQHEKIGYCSKSHLIIPNGFNVDILRPSVEARRSFRVEIGLKKDSILIGMISRYHPMKDHSNFLSAAAILLQKINNIYFVLVGENVDLNNRELCEIVDKLNLGDHIQLLGERNDISKIMPALDILTSSSSYGEAFPLVVGEAMSCGVPCVVTAVGDSDLIVGNTGRVVEPQNPEKIANAWQELLFLSTEDRMHLCKNSRKRIVQLFSLDSVVDQYESVYKQLASNNNSKSFSF